MVVRLISQGMLPSSSHIEVTGVKVRGGKPPNHRAELRLPKLLLDVSQIKDWTCQVNSHLCHFIQVLVLMSLP